MSLRQKKRRKVSETHESVEEDIESEDADSDGQEKTTDAEEQEQAIAEDSVAKEVEVCTMEDGFIHDNSSSKAIQLGEQFFSFEHYRTRIQEHQQATNTSFSLQDTKLLTWFLKPGRNAQSVAHANPELKYQFFCSACTLGGKTRKSTGKNIRNKLSNKIGCPARFFVKLSKDGKSLYVFKMKPQHNHEVGAHITIKTKSATRAKMEFADGFLYKKYMENGDVILKCQTKSCKGKATEANGNITLIQPHNHDQSAMSDRLQQCLDIMKQRARMEATPLKQILADTSEQYPGTINYKNTKYLSLTLKKCREDSEPAVPNSLLALSKMLIEDAWRLRYGGNLEDFPRELFIGCIKAQETEVAAIFASLFICERFNGPVEEMHIDCRENFIPDVPTDMKYLLSIHFVKKNMFYPAVVAFMSSDSPSMIDGLMRYLQVEVMQNTTPDVIFVDLLWGVQLILSSRFPGSLIENSFIYFSRRIWQKANELGLLNIDHSASTVNCMQTLSCLPLLPPDKIILGLEEFESSLPDELISTPFFHAIVQHIRDTWIDSPGPINLTIHDSHARSNTLVQQFCLQLKASIVEKQPNVWHLITAIQKLEAQGMQCYSREISEEPAAVTSLANVCQLIYDEKVKQIEYQILIDQISPLKGMEKLKLRPLVKSLVPDTLVEQPIMENICVETIIEES